MEGAGGFLPQFDDDGNQTLIETATGVWSVTYNGENRPVAWTCGTTNIVMKFDRMGRRVEYLETVGGVTNAHHRFMYDGYLCIQRLNAASNNAIDLVFGWDPSEPVATRPLVLQKYGQYNMFYTHDGNKNVSELVFFQQANGIAAHYEYAPFGAVTATSRSTPVTAYDFCEYNPFRFSSEYCDISICLMFYNYRHYETTIGRWLSKDPLLPYTHYRFIRNDVLCNVDFLGLIKFQRNCPFDFVRKCEKELEEILDILKRYKNKISDNNVRNINKILNDGGFFSGDLRIPKGAWGNQSVVRDNIELIIRKLKGPTEIACCGRLCQVDDAGNPFAMYISRTEERSHFINYKGMIIICDKGVNHSELVGGCGCLILHEILHIFGLRAIENEYKQKNFRRDEALIKLSNEFLQSSRKFNCKGYGLR